MNKEAAPPVCPECGGRLVLRGYARYRCAACLLEWPTPIPAAEELPALKDCPRCARLGVRRKMIRVNGMWQWCVACNYEELVLTPAQRARIDGAQRRVVGGCYGELDVQAKPARRGSGGNRRRTHKPAKKFSRRYPLPD